MDATSHPGEPELESVNREPATLDTNSHDLEQPDAEGPGATDRWAAGPEASQAEDREDVKQRWARSSGSYTRRQLAILWVVVATSGAIWLALLFRGMTPELGRAVNAVLVLVGSAKRL